jgi:DNA-binding MarR family transcriptional regulator
VLVEKRLVNDAQVEPNAIASRLELTPIGQALLARFDEAA